MTSYWAQVQSLLDSGARSFFFVDIPPIDQTPAMIKAGPIAQKAMATFIANFNRLLNNNCEILYNTEFWGDQFPNFAAGSPGFAQVVSSNDGWSVMLEEYYLLGIRDTQCIDPDGTTCYWTDEWTPGWELQDIVGTYVGVFSQGLLVS
jgi:hypothetical protein